MAAINDCSPFLSINGCSPFLLILSAIASCQLPVALSQPNSSQPIRFTVAEKSLPGTYVGNVFDDLALGLDPGVQVNLRFSFRSTDPDSSYFSINETTGSISTSTKTIDRDVICAYSSTCALQFQVQVLPPKYFQVLNVYVVVADINDHAPVFTPSSFRLNISEADSPGKLYLLPGADDPDGGTDGVQGYRLEPNSTKFQLSVGYLADGSSDVRLRLMERLKRSEVSSYSLVVLAFDGGQPSKTGSLSISIIVVDSTTSQQSLSFENSTYEANVAENLPVGTSVLKVQAGYQGASTDSSKTDQIVYEMDRSTQLNIPMYFWINNLTGVVYIATPLDHEQHPLVLVTLTATDRSRPSSVPAYARVTVVITDSNDNAPVVTVTTLTADGIAEVKDSSPIDSFVAYLGVTDPDDDLNGQVSCAINSTRFHLDPVYTDYKLKTSVRFDSESATQYAVSVTCVDRGSPPLTSSVVVMVRVILTGPVFLSDRTVVSVYEGNRIGDAIVALNVTDRDSTDRDSMLSLLSFGCSSIGDSPSSAVSVDVTSGVVTSNVVFRYDVRRQYSYVVTVSDVRSPTVTATSTLIVNILRLPPLSTGASTPPGEAVLTPAGAEKNQAGFKNTDTVVILAVVCATVIVVVITVVVAVAIVCYRRNQQKAFVSAAVQLANGSSSIYSDGSNRLVRSVSSVSSSVGSANGDKRDSKLGSIREESFEELQITPTDEWPPNIGPGLPTYPDCNLQSTIGRDPSFRTQSMGGMYVRSVSHPDNQNHHHHHHHRTRSARAARYNDRMAEDPSMDISRVTDGESSSCWSGSLTDSGRGHSLKDDSCVGTAINGRGQQYAHPPPPPPPPTPPPPAPPPSQVFRQDSDSSASSSRPLVQPAKSKFPIENKIYITNNFRDALPRHSSRLDPEVKRDPGVKRDQGHARTEANRRDYYDARSRSLERSRGDSMKAQEEVEDFTTAAPSRYDRVGEFTRSLYAGQDNVGFDRGSSRKQQPRYEVTNDEVAISGSSSGRQFQSSEEDNRVNSGHCRVEGRVCDTFV